MQSPVLNNVEFSYKGLPNNEQVIIMAHGVLDNGRNMIIWTQEDVDKYYHSESALISFFKSSSSDGRFLFLGSSLFDDFFTKEIKKEKYYNFAIMPVFAEGEQKVGEIEKQNIILEELGIIPLFYPAYPLYSEDCREKHDWVRRIMKWLIGGKPFHKYEIEDLKEKIKVLSDDYIKLGVYNSTEIFPNEHFNIDELANFLSYHGKFRWWEISEDINGSKIRYIKNFVRYARINNWYVRWFATTNYDDYENFNNFFELAALDQNTLLIFDDAEYYPHSDEYWKTYCENGIKPKSTKERFSDKFLFIHDKLMERNCKLRVIFTYTEQISENVIKTKEDAWWRSTTVKLDGLLIDKYYTESNVPLNLKLSSDDVAEMLGYYISKKYSSFDEGFRAKFFNWWNDKHYEEVLYSPVIGVICVDLFAEAINRETVLSHEIAIMTALNRLSSLSDILPPTEDMCSMGNPHRDSMVKMWESVYRLGHSEKFTHLFKPSARGKTHSSSDGGTPQEIKDDKDFRND